MTNLVPFSDTPHHKKASNLPIVRNMVIIITLLLGSVPPVIDSNMLTGAASITGDTRRHEHANRHICYCVSCVVIDLFNQLSH